MKVTLASKLLYPQPNILSKRQDEKNRPADSSQAAERTDQLEFSKSPLLNLGVQQKTSDNLLDLYSPKSEDSSENSMAKALETMKTCAKIASRIRKGDNVPLKDLRYLMKNDPQLYQMSVALRAHKANPKKHKSLVKEDDQPQQDSSVPQTTSDPPIEVSSGEGCETEGSSSEGAPSSSAE